MATDNLSLVLHGINNLQLEQRPLPSKPGSNEALVAIHSVGICGSDVHFWVDGHIGNYWVKEPMVLGHETSAIVIEVGQGVKHIKSGDRVALEVGIPCRMCEYCKTGRYNLCPEIKFCATPPTDGTLTRYFLIAADFCYKLPDHVTLEEGAMLEPLNVAVSACKRGTLTVGENVLILGAGPIGLMSLLVAKSYGAKAVCVTDINPARLEFSKTMGADHTVLVDKKDESELAEIIQITLGDKPTLTLECSGAESSIRLALAATKSGGRVVLIGLGSDEIRVPLLHAAIREVDIIGNFRYCNCYPTALMLVATGKVNMKPLITHRFILEESKEAFELVRTGKDKVIKAIIKCAK